MVGTPLTLHDEGERRDRFRPVRRGEVFIARLAGTTLGVVPQISFTEDEGAVLTQPTFPDVGNIVKGSALCGVSKALHRGFAVSSVPKALHWGFARRKFGTVCTALRLVPLGFRKIGTLR